LREVRYAGVILVVGLVIYLVRARRNQEWPWQPSSAATS
jgi:hypothetical protein